jgi:lysozyme family protein
MVRYLELWESAVISREALHRQDLDWICRIILIHEQIYQQVQASTGVPWFVAACIHSRESDLNFKKHLHNGDPLTNRTVNVPKGRPVHGYPTFAWEVSAADALTDFWKPKVWNIAGCLEFFERYNGLGYQRCGINSPYLWDYTQHYTKGLFVRDGKFDPTKHEVRAGCVAIMKSLQERGVILLGLNDHDQVLQ